MAFTDMQHLTGSGIDGLFEKSKENIAKYNWGELGAAVVDDIGSGINNAMPGALRFIEELCNKITAKVKETFKISASLSAVFMDIGKNIMQGFIVGVLTKRADMLKVVTGAMSDIVEAVNETLQINSPSRVFKEIGENIGASFGSGFIDIMDKVERDMQEAIPTEFDLNMVLTGVKPAFDLTGVNAAGAFESQGEISIVNNFNFNGLVVRDEKDVELIADKAIQIMTKKLIKVNKSRGVNIPWF
jgi:hypothetical protein